MRAIGLLSPLAVLALLGCEAAAVPKGTAREPQAAEAFLDTLQQRTFAFFSETTNPENGLTPDRWPSRPFSSIAAVGFALSAYLVGVERGFVSREEARARTATTLRFFWNAPQGPDSVNVTGHKGFFYHFLDMETGLRFQKTELSTIDTAILLADILSAQVDDDYLGIDQGPILPMIENHRSGFLWDLMKGNEHIVRGLCRAGFSGGWLEGRC